MIRKKQLQANIRHLNARIEMLEQKIPQLSEENDFLIREYLSELKKPVLNDCNKFGTLLVYLPLEMKILRANVMYSNRRIINNYGSPSLVSEYIITPCDGKKPSFIANIHQTMLYEIPQGKA